MVRPMPSTCNRGGGGGCGSCCGACFFVFLVFFEMGSSAKLKRFLPPRRWT